MRNAREDPKQERERGSTEGDGDFESARGTASLSRGHSGQSLNSEGPPALRQLSRRKGRWQGCEREACEPGAWGHTEGRGREGAGPLHSQRCPQAWLSLRRKGRSAECSDRRTTGPDVMADLRGPLGWATGGAAMWLSTFPGVCMRVFLQETGM